VHGERRSETTHPTKTRVATPNARHSRSSKDWLTLSLRLTTLNATPAVAIRKPKRYPTIFWCRHLNSDRLRKAEKDQDTGGKYQKDCTEAIQENLPHTASLRRTG